MKTTTTLSTLFAIILIFSLQEMKAQPSGSTWLSTTAGINSTWIINQNAYGNQEMDYGTKFGLQASIGLNHYLNTRYGLSTGLGFGNFGQNYHGEQSGAKATRKVNLNYIMIPVLGMKQLCDPQHPCWLTFGPQLMFLTSGSQKYSREEGSPLSNPEYLTEGKKDVSKWYKPVDVMLTIGFSNLYSMRSNDKFRMILSYNAAIGLLDLNAKSYQIPNLHDIYKASHNFYLGVQAGFIFNP